VCAHCAHTVRTLCAQSDGAHAMGDTLNADAASGAAVAAAAGQHRSVCTCCHVRPVVQFRRADGTSADRKHGMCRPCYDASRHQNKSASVAARDFGFALAAGNAEERGSAPSVEDASSPQGAALIFVYLRCALLLSRGCAQARVLGAPCLAKWPFCPARRPLHHLPTATYRVCGIIGSWVQGWLRSPPT
jgi:hypothetical protein